MADKLDRMIQDKAREVSEVRSQIQGLQRSLEIMEAQLAGLEAAAELRPSVAQEIKKGRQPGAISREWRGVLNRVWMLGPLTYQGIRDAAASEGLNVDISNVRERVRTFVKSSLLEGDPEGGFSVTNEAAERFGFARAFDAPQVQSRRIDE